MLSKYWKAVGNVSCLMPVPDSLGPELVRVSKLTEEAVEEKSSLAGFSCKDYFGLRLQRVDKR